MHSLIFSFAGNNYPINLTAANYFVVDKALLSAVM